MHTSQTQPQPLDTPLGALSLREIQVLTLASRGSTNSQIADGLGVSVHAVKWHLASVYRKLRVTNRTEAAVVFVSAGGETTAPTDITEGS
jgi:DNA-binding CsgD family transcriptional regulator